MTIRTFLGVVTRTVTCVSCHRDGSVTYFDPGAKTWIEAARTIPAHILADLPADEVARVQRHLIRHGVFP